MTTAVEVFSAFGSTESERKAEILTMQVPDRPRKPRNNGARLTPPPPPPPPSVDPDGVQTCAQTRKFCCRGGLVTEKGLISNARSRAEVRRRGAPTRSAPPSCSIDRKHRGDSKSHVLDARRWKTAVWMHDVVPPGGITLACYFGRRVTAFTLESPGQAGTWELPKLVRRSSLSTNSECEKVKASLRRRRLLSVGAIAQQPDDHLPNRLQSGQPIKRRDP